MKTEIMKHIENIIDIFVKDKDKRFKELDENLSKKIDKIDSSIDSMFSYLKDDAKNARDEAKKAIDEKTEAENLSNKKFQDVQSEVSSLNTKNSKLDEEIKELRKSHKDKEADIATLKREKGETEETLSKRTSELNSNKLKIETLQPFEDVFHEKKLAKLLRTILDNPALENYRDKESIKDTSAQSIFNLVKHLSSAKVFISSYYDNLVEYKKKNQDEMRDEETDFYEALNHYFGDEYIKSIQKKEDRGFDKACHRGIKGESNGEIDDGIILIPADTTNNDKIKVKIKG